MKNLEKRRLLTVNEVAELCNFNHQVVRSWIKNGDLVAMRFGNSIRIERHELEKFWIESGGAPLFDE